MFEMLADGDRRALPSRYWEELNRMNMEQLKQNGFENFKRTIALNYFTWTRILPWDDQIAFLCAQLPIKMAANCFLKAVTMRRHSFFSSFDFVQSFSYNFLSLLEWEYLLRLPLPPRFMEIREPKEGNPAIITPRPGMAVSQDLANSILEFDSFWSVLPPSEKLTVLELGAGYGRNAYVIIKLLPRVKYVVVDIPPALYVAERYLSRIFPDKTIFKTRGFSRFEEVAEEFARSDIVFLLSTQLSKLPSRSVDFIINISSLHEMRKDQINYFFERFDDVLKFGGHFYSKQWKKARVLFENITLLENDYPIPPDWNKIFSRTARVQTKFFEALYQKLHKPPHLRSKT